MRRGGWVVALAVLGGSPAASSAALLFNLLPALAQLPAAEQYRRLVGFLEGHLNAYDDVPEPEYRPYEPSEN